MDDQKKAELERRVEQLRKGKAEVEANDPRPMTPEMEMVEERKSRDYEALIAKEVAREAREQLLQEELTPAEAAARRATKKARMAQVLSRGVLSTKLQQLIDMVVPPGYIGKFVRDTPEDIMKYKNLNYDFNYREGDHKGLHGTGDGRIRVGDVVLMTIAKEDHEILREINSDRVMSNFTRARGEYVNRSIEEAEKFGGRGAMPFDESEVRIITNK